MKGVGKGTRTREVWVGRGLIISARTVVAQTVIGGCMVSSCCEQTLFQGSPCEINLYLEVALSDMLRSCIVDPYC